MSADPETRADLEARIETIEAGYEFLLAYAAQGRATDRGTGGRSDVREHLNAVAEALEGLGDAVARSVGGHDADAAEAARPFLDAVAADASVALGVVRLVLAQADVSSQLIDNLNASIHVRALLTDLFVIDESLKGKPAG